MLQIITGIQGRQCACLQDASLMYGPIDISYRISDTAAGLLLVREASLEFCDNPLQQENKKY